MGKILEIGRNYRIEWRFHEVGGRGCYKGENFLEAGGRLLVKVGNFHETDVGLLAKVKIFLRRMGAC